MNNISLVGRLTATPEIRKTPNDISVVRFTVAVDRPFKQEHETDFIECIAWRNTADFIGKYFEKGQRIGLNGSLQTETYMDKNGINRKSYNVVVSNCEFVEKKQQNSTQIDTQNITNDDLPF